MRLLSFQIQNCFGFQDSGDIDFSDVGNLTYLLGRNSSGKTSVLTALKAMESKEPPQTYPRFKNYEQLASVRAKPPLTISCAIEPGDDSILSVDQLMMLVIQACSQVGLKPSRNKEGYQALVGSARRPKIEAVLDGVRDIYSDLINRIISAMELTVQRTANGSYAFIAPGDTEATQQDRLGEVNKLIKTNLGDPPRW